MTLDGTPIVVVWFLVLTGAGWALAKGLLHRTWKRTDAGTDVFCRYCGWGLSRAAGFDVYRWEGETFCSLICLRRDAELREIEKRA
jgi:hypothetical protein